MRLAALAMTLSLLVAGGCALTSKAEPLSIRWFTPETSRPRLTAVTPESATPAAGAPALELGRVSSGGNLREKIAYRGAAFEVGFYEDKRWTARPEVYVRRELARTLFEERGVRRALAGEAPVLDVEVLAFEQVRGPAPAARIQLHFMIHDERETFLERTITVDRPVPGDGFDAFVQAMAGALDAAATDIAAQTESVLRARQPSRRQE